MLFCSGASAALRSIDVATPRNFGYVIGDLIHHKAQLTLELPYKIEVDALPQAGRLGRWLWLREPQFTSHTQGDATVYHIQFTYQLLSAPEAIQQLFTPQHTLYFVGDNQRLPIFIEPWAFTAGPLVKRGTDGVKFTDIKPELPPPPIPLWGYWIGLLLGVSGLVGAMLVLMYIRWGLPWIARSRGPFARAYHNMRRLTASSSQPQYEEALRLTHRAFDETAGATVFAGTLAEFFTDNPRFESQRRSIEGFYTESQQQFFASRAPTATPSYDALVSLCRVCRDIERGLA